MRQVATRLLLSSALVSVLMQGLAAADSWTWRDRDDQSRPLSIHSVTAAHDDEGPTVTVAFDQPMRPEEMGEKDFIIVAVDSDGEEPNEEWIYLVSVEGQLQRFSYNPRTEEAYPIADWTFSRPTPESVTVKVTAHAPGYSHAFFAGSYTESAPGCAGGCWDSVPYRGGLIHDWTPPQVKGVREPSTWTFESTLKFYWEALDYGLSGFRRSTLLMTEPGSGKWRVVATRTEPGRYQLRIRGLEQGGNVGLRPVAQDGAGNKALGPIRRTRLPYDQANPDAPGRFTGLWAEEETNAFGGSVHTSTAPMDSLVFPGRGNLYCFHGRWGPDPVRATFEAGGETVEIDTLAGGGYSDGFPTCIETATVEPRSATLVVHAGRVSVDWYWAGVYPPETDVAERRVVDHSASGDLPPARSLVVPARDLEAGARAVRGLLNRS